MCGLTTIDNPNPYYGDIITYYPTLNEVQGSTIVLEEKDSLS
jgi:hypothetical protein